MKLNEFLFWAYCLSYLIIFNLNILLVSLSFFDNYQIGIFLGGVGLIVSTMLFLPLINISLKLMWNEIITSNNQHIKRNKGGSNEKNTNN